LLTIAGSFGCEAAKDRHQRHQYGKHNCRQKTRHYTENNRRNAINPLQPGELVSEVADVRNHTDNSHGDGKEDDHDSDDTSRQKPSDEVLSRLDA
jgi:hypothetical protein